MSSQISNTFGLFLVWIQYELALLNLLFCFVTWGILMNKVLLMILIASISLTAQILFAQETGYNNHEQSNIHHRHHIGLFLGGTSSLDNGTAHFTAGLDYEFKFVTKPVFGLGLLAEGIFSTENEYIIGLPVIVHPWNSLKIWVAPCIEIPEKTKSPIKEYPPDKIKHNEILSTVSEEADGSHFLLRIGAGYDILIGKMVLTPSLCFDKILDNTFLVYGLTFGIGF